mmetsp:Transcript_244/g.302  ORF Transcript_244/g.302 Transcript_244/m.302 type:complete len:292 (-) Transcript_244:1149-2024(-)|eukprot:CAMPEP_0184031558 /NCGR_PEP_ID=MMETSP0955-20130417/2339_1 /TAXON_ID=627963 /ORGANISM="Aplanochytrium sp, Strain PBS07" /LENGTH=291 /DNA_ID=CAMNT_0026317347 /DNA_START=86 /DNA_END=961 /DNA_ORIENTATION=-
MSADRELLHAATVGDIDTVYDLVDDDANVNYQDVHGMTPLIIAAANGHADIVRTLIENGANVEITSSHGETALLFAASKGRLNAVKALVEGDADLEAENRYGNTPIILAAINGRSKTSKYLAYAGANIHHKNHKNETCIDKAKNDDIRTGIERAAHKLVFEADRKARESFSMEIEMGQNEVVDWLLKHNLRHVAEKALFHGLSSFEITSKCAEAELFRALDVKRLGDKIVLRESPLLSGEDDTDGDLQNYKSNTPLSSSVKSRKSKMSWDDDNASDDSTDTFTTFGVHAGD